MIDSQTFQEDHECLIVVVQGGIMHSWSDTPTMRRKNTESHFVGMGIHKDHVTQNYCVKVGPIGKWGLGQS